MTLQRVAGLALVALLPVLAFVLGRNTPLTALAAVNVLIIGASLYLMWAPVHSSTPAPAQG